MKPKKKNVKFLTSQEVLNNVYDKILHDEDYIALKRFNYSIKEIMERYPEGAPDRIIASALMVPEEDVQKIYDSAITKIRDLLGIE
jgi:hypothetical protein